MNRYLKIPLVASSLFLISGCNIYRQMTLPTPYYPNGAGNARANVNNNLGQEVREGISSDRVTGTLTDASRANSEGTITPVNSNGNVASVNKTIVQRIPFPVDEYKSLAKTGSATVDGHIYITTSGGNKVVGKNTRLYLNPVTSYSTQWFNKSYLGGAKMSKVDPRLFNYLKFTTSDSSGKFEFLNVPSGSYYLIGVVKCGTACGYDKVKNIRIAKKISVFGNDIKEVDLTKQVQ
jgi:hypothetical protein